MLPNYSVGHPVEDSMSNWTVSWEQSGTSQLKGCATNFCPSMTKFTLDMCIHWMKFYILSSPHFLSFQRLPAEAQVMRSSGVWTVLGFRFFGLEARARRKSILEDNILWQRRGPPSTAGTGLQRSLYTTDPRRGRHRYLTAKWGKEGLGGREKNHKF